MRLTGQAAQGVNVLRSVTPASMQVQRDTKTDFRFRPVRLEQLPLLEERPELRLPPQLPALPLPQPGSRERSTDAPEAEQAARSESSGSNRPAHKW